MRELDYDKLCSDIQSWIKHYVYSAGAKGVVVGLSGGIDSAVTAALCGNAIGRENVIGLALPCESISEDLEDAKKIASTLNIEFQIIDLTPTFKVFMNSLDVLINSNKVAVANLKPRLRMMALYYVGQSKGNYLVAGTGNRAEIAIGYFTKYGDGGVDFEPLGLIYKNEVRKLARILKIPEKIITKAPSPGLWLGQTDEGEIGLSYDNIDEILFRMDNNLNLDDLNQEEVNKVFSLMKKAEHKNRMAPFYNFT
ncbi:MAG: NAD+ synthase [Promethearchaeota archaeon]